MIHRERKRHQRSFSFNDPIVINAMRNATDEALAQFAIPMFVNGGRSTYRDADGFPEVTEGNLQNLYELQAECWRKAESNPQINSHIRDQMGRMAGMGFKFSSEVADINSVIEEISEDPRNDLYQNFPKFCGRSEIEGELFLIFTLHRNGFVEVDFIPPSSIRGGGDENSGIIFHSRKKSFPLFYNVNTTTYNHTTLGSSQMTLVPSVNIAYFPELIKDAMTHSSWDESKTRMNKDPHPVYKQFGNYFRFIVHWNKGLMVSRNVSHIKTTIEWVNYYEMLKKYEIDHKRSSGAYLWVIKVDDKSTLRRWLLMTEEERKATGIMQVKEPGGTIVLPPGMSLDVLNPKLPTISDQDNDIMQMISSGLQKPQDTMLGDYKSTYASVKAAQGPQGDRILDELHYFRLFLRYSFWRPIFYLVSSVRSEFKYFRKATHIVEFKNKKAIKKKVDRPVYKFVDIRLPVSRLDDLKEIGSVLLGTKHGSIVDTLGIPRREIAEKLGFTNYAQLRAEKEMEDEKYPETLSVLDQEAAQEKVESGASEANPDDKDDDVEKEKTKKKSKNVKKK